MPKISIVLPVYNGERYLQGAIESILDQTYTDWELILVDDCSVDSTPQIIDYYSTKDERIMAIHNETNQKLPKSLNIGFAASCGEYLTWTSDDNLYFPNALEVMAKYLDEMKEIYMVRADMQIIDEKGEVIENFEEYSDKKMYLRNCLGACFMYRRIVKDRIGDYNEDTFGVEDYDYWIRVLNDFGEILSINEILYQYRRHEKSLSATKKSYVLDQLVKLRIRYLSSIFKKYGNEKDKLCQLYYEMLQSEKMDENTIQSFKNEVLELNGDVGFNDKNKFIIFGAGVYGQKAVEVLRDKAAFFMDNNLEIVDTVVKGLRILSFDDAVKASERYTIIISVAPERVYEMMRQLQEVGINEYSVYWSYIKMIVNNGRDDKE